ncbi:hypothetical protein [Thiomicrorhabdus cannonii]|uniref:hypothetical protein n=1 Tax=Thiomicrorhabdus cannonii TaxID=2748011 RepID=UPI0015B83486|nr:hypothetical protein [Thiomicrorhabdus cannonii]
MVALNLDGVLKMNNQFKEELQVMVLTEMSDQFKRAYVQVIVNMTFDDDKNIDADELSEILLLMTRLQLSKEVRFDVRTYIDSISEETQIATKTLISEIKELSDSSQHQSVMISLVKDIINAHYSSKKNFDGDVSFVALNKELFGLSEKEINFAYQAVLDGFKILDENVDDNKIREGASKLAATAAAVGAPIAAVYISGSVVGLSAAGVTSGLATLGLGMGVTGGLAVLGAVGFLTYAGVRHVSGVSELDKFKVKQMMLNEALKQTHLTIKEVIEDINYLVSKLNETMAESEINREKLLIAEDKVSRFVAALKKISDRADRFENSVSRTKCPKKLYQYGFYKLSKEPTKKPLYDFVMKHYFKADQEGGVVYFLNDRASTSELDKVAEILEKLGYFDEVKSFDARVRRVTRSFFKYR